VKRLTELFRSGGMNSMKDEKGRKEMIKDDEMKNIMVARGTQMSMIARLARRPLYNQENFNTLGIVKQVRELQPKKYVQLVENGHKILDRIGRSIFMKNVMSISEKRDACFITTAAVKATLCGDMQVKSQIRNEFQGISRRWLRQGILVFVKLNMVNRGAKNAMDLFGNTTKWGWKTADKFE
jgi:hypothetical protein